MNEKAKAVCDLIQANRRSRKFTMQRLADLSGVSKAAIRKIEAGGNPSVETVVRLAEAMGMKPVDLFP